jgi:hypothetical protein
MLFLCSHLSGPRSLRDPPLFGGGPGHPSMIRDWLTADNLRSLGHMKFSHMGAHFKDTVLSHVSPYFTALQPHIISLWHALFPNGFQGEGQEASHSLATLRDLINTFKDVLLDPALIKLEQSLSSNSKKRSRPGELIISGNGWDAIPPSKRRATPKTNVQKNRRHFLTKNKSKK